MGSGCRGVKDSEGVSKIDGGSGGNSEASMDPEQSVMYIDGSSVMLSQMVKPEASQNASTAIQSKAEDIHSSFG